MNILERTLSKLTIRGFSDREMSRQVGSVTAMYNPDSLRLNYRSNYSQDDFINSISQTNTYQTSSPGSLYLDLVFDARMPGNKRSVEEQITELHELCYPVNPSTGEPHFLAVSWGKLLIGGVAGRDFNGRCIDFSVNYTLFERDGSPLRATVSLALSADASVILQAAVQNLKSPKVAVISVPDGCYLPLVSMLGAHLVKGQIDCLVLADENDLDSLHAIEPGQALIVPSNEEQL
ncbi:hypothetical protein [Aeromonas veronii]|uniref:CIS tube protein n=1 Tax=Aeromonas veronii TaxID=654 RepID=UPI001011FE40|nr:hypothetical protein [Aeromonas veronii]